MLYGLLMISLIVFFIFGYGLMSRLDRFLNPKKAVQNKRAKSFSFDKYHHAWRRAKKHLSKGAEVYICPTYGNALSGEANQ